MRGLKNVSVFKSAIKTHIQIHQSHTLVCIRKLWEKTTAAHIPNIFCFSIDFHENIFCCACFTHFNSFIIYILPFTWQRYTVKATDLSLLTLRCIRIKITLLNCTTTFRNLIWMRLFIECLWKVQIEAHRNFVVVCALQPFLIFISYYVCELMYFALNINSLHWIWLWYNSMQTLLYTIE